MSRCVYKVINIFFAILGFIYNTYSLGLNRNTTFTLKLHIIQYLCLHLTAGQSTCLLNDAVCQC